MPSELRRSAISLPKLSRVSFRSDTPTVKRQVADVSMDDVSQFFYSPLPQIEMIQRDDDEGVADFFTGDELLDFRDWHEARDQIFAAVEFLSLIHISEPTRQAEISYA